MKVLDTKRTITETPLSTLCCKLLGMLMLLLAAVFVALALRTFLSVLFTALLNDLGSGSSKQFFNVALPAIITDCLLAAACYFSAEWMFSEPRQLIGLVATTKERGPSPDA